MISNSYIQTFKLLSSCPHLHKAFLHTVHLPPHVAMVEHNVPWGKHVRGHGQGDLTQEAGVRMLEHWEVVEEGRTLLHAHILTHTLRHVVHQTISPRNSLAPVISRVE